MTEFFISIYRYFQTRRFLFFAIVVGLFAISVYFAVHIKLEEDISGFMPNTPETERTNFILRNLNTNDKIIIKLSATDTTMTDMHDYLMAYADTLVDSLNINPGVNYISDIFYKVDDSRITGTFDFVLQNLPLFIDESDYQRLDSLLTPEGIQSILEQNKKDIVSPMGMIYKRYIIADPLHLSNKTLADLSSKAIDSLYNNYNGYIFSKDNNNLLIFITSAYGIGETGKNQVLARALEDNINEVIGRSNGKLAITSFGAAIVGVSNAEQIKKDSFISITVSVVLILSLLLLFFKNARSILLLLVPVIFGVALSLALLFFIRGTISAIAIGAGSAIFGIAVNYTLHFLVHYKHCASVELTIKDLASPLLVGSITTVGAFLSLLFVSSSALGDFGLFAALSLTGTIIFVLVFMPFFVKWASPSVTNYSLVFDRISDLKLDQNNWVIITVVLLTIVFAFFSRKLTFESDMNKISYMTTEQRKAFNELTGFTNLSDKSIVHVSEGHNMNEALRHYEAAISTIDSLVRTRAIKSVSGIGNMVLSDSLQKQKIDKWNNFWLHKRQNVRGLFENKGDIVGFKENSFERFFNTLNKEYTVKNPDQLLLDNDIASGYVINKTDRAYIITLLYVTPENEEIVKKTLNNSGTFVFDRASANKATVNVLSDDFNMVLWVCALFVLFFLSLSFGRFELSFLTFIPMVVGWIWILGLMAIFGIKFNIVNIILATFIFGLGDDYSIFIMEGSMHEYAYNRKILSSYKLAVMLSALTMFIGIGSLIFARHPAMKSLAQVTIIGMISVVIISYTVIPFLYRWLTLYKWQKRILPITAQNLMTTVFSFVVFLFGSLYLSIIGFFLFKVTRPDDRKKLFFHRCLSSAAGFVAVRIPQVKTEIINRNNEDFSKPSVIVCNHQSHIDLMFVMMLSPRIAIMTNEWVWNSPFYGNIVKYADFYPVANGIENSMEHLTELVEKGYSIMIFPEGTRSKDCSINRFHKGAFYLAEKLKLDIIPLIIHGMGHVFPKPDFLLRKGIATIEILDRIKPDDKSYGESYSLRAKYVRRMYKSEYLRIASRKETPDYFVYKLYHNYIYKGSAISAKVKTDLKKHNNYSDIINSLPSKGSVLVLGAGSGSFTLLLSMVKPELIIDAVEADENKLALARNCASCTANTVYINANPLYFEIAKKYDAIILPDFLQAIKSSEQQQLIRNCIQYSPLLLIGNIVYSFTERIFLRLSGNDLNKVNEVNLPDLKQISDEFSFNITRSDNLFTIYRKS